MANPEQRRRQLIDAAAAMHRSILEERLTGGTLTLDQIEAVVKEISREHSKSLEGILIEQHQPEQTNKSACPKCSRLCNYKRNIDIKVTTIHGVQTIRRRNHYCKACRHGFSPTDAALGLEAGRNATRRFRALLADYGSREAFADVPALLQKFLGIPVSASTVERTTVEVGQRIREAARTWSPVGDPARPDSQRRYLSLDGTMCPLRDRWKRSGSLGKLRCRYGEAKLGIVFEAGQKDGSDTGVVRRGTIGTLGSIDTFDAMVAELGRQWSLESAKELIVIADGAHWIWNLAEKHFPEAIQILDYWHMTEHLYAVANAMHGAGTQEAKSWVEGAQFELDRDLMACFQLRLESWAPGSEAAKEVRRVELAFFQANSERMRYETFRKKGYMIGSGVMESTCRQLAAERLDKAGMHWRDTNADAVLAVRAHCLSTGAPDLSQYA